MWPGKVWTIYGLFAPNSKCISYVGCTGAPLAHRLTEHLRVCRTENTRKDRWLRSLRQAGLTPDIRPLALCGDAETAQIVEAALISRWRPPLNSTPDGRGGGTSVPRPGAGRPRPLVDLDSNEVYPSVSAAARALGVTEKTVRRHLLGEVGRVRGRVLDVILDQQLPKAA